MSARIRPLLAAVLMVAAAGCRTAPLDFPIGEGDGGFPENADLTGVDLTGVDLTHVAPPDLTGVAIVDLAVPPNADLSGRPVDLSVSLVDMARRSDMSTIRDMVYVPPTDASGLSCGNLTCTIGQKCCVLRQGMGITTQCATSCPDGGVATINCDGPGTCGGNPCCISGGQMGFGQVACQASPTACVPVLDFNTRSLTTRLCHADGDCTAGGITTQLNRCCTISQMGFTGQICLNPQYAQFLGARCP